MLHFLAPGRRLVRRYFISTEKAAIAGMSSTGTVRVWHQDEGWGVIDSPDTPGGCWAGFAQIWADGMPKPGRGEYVVSGFTELFEGETVDFEWERPSADQDGYAFRATTVRPPWEATTTPCRCS